MSSTADGCDLGRSQTPPAHLLLLCFEGKLLGGVLANRLQQGPPLHFCPSRSGDEPLRLQGVQVPAHLHFVEIRCCDCVRSRGREPTRECRQAPQEDTLGCLEQPIAPIERGSNAAIAIRVAISGRPVDTTAGGQSIGNLGGGQRVDARHGETEREGKAVELVTDARHGSGRGRRQGKPSVHGHRAIDEQPTRVRTDHGADPIADLRQAERAEAKHPFTRDPEGRPARGQRSHPRRSREQVGDERREDRHQMLTVVQDEQNLARDKSLPQRLRRAQPRALARSDSAQQRIDEVFGVAHARELDHHAVRRPRLGSETGRQLERDSRLAAATGARERQQARRTHAALYVGEFPLAANQRPLRHHPRRSLQKRRVPWRNRSRAPSGTSAQLGPRLAPRRGRVRKPVLRPHSRRHLRFDAEG